MNKLLPLALLAFTSQTFAYSEYEITGNWECIEPGLTYTKKFTSDGKFESFGGGTTHFIGNFSVSGSVLSVSFRDFESSNPSNDLDSAYTIAKLTDSQLVLQSGNRLVACQK